jgi:hypothetical protein
MSTFEYLTPGEAVAAARADAPEWRQIVGLKGADSAWVPRTPKGKQHKPEHTWEARRYMEKNGREVARVVRSEEDGTGEECDPGMVTVFFTDGMHTYIGVDDLLCVERPVTGA